MTGSALLWAVLGLFVVCTGILVALCIQADRRPRTRYDDPPYDWSSDVLDFVKVPLDAPAGEVTRPRVPPAPPASSPQPARREAMRSEKGRSSAASSPHPQTVAPASTAPSRGQVEAPDEPHP